MLVFTKLLILFAAILLVAGSVVYFMGYHISGNASLNYYSSASSPSAASNNFVQNGTTTIKYLGIFMVLVGIVFLICAAVNESMKLSQKFHHLKYSKPLH